MRLGMRGDWLWGRQYALPRRQMIKRHASASFDIPWLSQSFVAGFNKLYHFETTYDISKGDLVGVAVEFKVHHGDDIDLVLEPPTLEGTYT